MLSAAKAVFSHHWNICVFCHIYAHSTAFTREVLWDGCAFQKIIRKKKLLTCLCKLWQISLKNKYWIRLSFISLSMPEFNIWPWKRCEWLNQQPKQSSGREVFGLCRSLLIRVFIRGETQGFELCYSQMKVFHVLFCNVLGCTQSMGRCTFLLNHLQLFYPFYFLF